MEITGRIIAVLPVQGGISKNGNEWKKQEYVLKQETIENPEAEIERMEKAKELLENTTLKNYEIAEKVGFSDPHYFGISFKKMTGKTPTEYAREKRR